MIIMNESDIQFRSANISIEGSGDIAIGMWVQTISNENTQLYNLVTKAFAFEEEDGITVLDELLLADCENCGLLADISEVCPYCDF